MRKRKKQTVARLASRSRNGHAAHLHVLFDQRDGRGLSVSRRVKRKDLQRNAEPFFALLRGLEAPRPSVSHHTEAEVASRVANHVVLDLNGLSCSIFAKLYSSVVNCEIAFVQDILGYCTERHISEAGPVCMRSSLRQRVAVSCRRPLPPAAAPLPREARPCRVGYRLCEAHAQRLCSGGNGNSKRWWMRRRCGYNNRGKYRAQRSSHPRATLAAAEPPQAKAAQSTSSPSS